MKNLFTLFLALCLLTCCSDDAIPDSVIIQGENSSEVDFKDLLISSGSGNVGFGDIKAGKKSDYREFESAYRYGFVSVLANGKELRIQPYDYVGETPLSKGYYTYKLDLKTSDPDKLFLTLELVVE